MGLLVAGWAAVGLLALAGIYVGFLGGIWGLIPGVPAVILFGALTLSMVRGARSAVWFLPFAWILIVPAVTVPTHIGLLGVITDGYRYEGAFASGEAGECTQVSQNRHDKLWECPAGAAAATLLPGLLNLMPLVGLASSRGRVRFASLVAGGLGAVRLLVPVAIYVADAPDVEIIGSWQWPPAMGSFTSAYASIALWFLSLGTAVVLIPRLGRPPDQARIAA